MADKELIRIGYRDIEPRCWRCKRKLAEDLTRPWNIVCQRCHARNISEPLDSKGNNDTLTA